MNRDAVSNAEDLETAWSDWFCALIRRDLVLHPDGPNDRHWRNRLFMVEQARLTYRLSGDSEDLLDDYRFWRERDPKLKSLAVSASRIRITEKHTSSILAARKF